MNINDIRCQLRFNPDQDDKNKIVLVRFISSNPLNLQEYIEFRDLINKIAISKFSYSAPIPPSDFDATIINVEVPNSKVADFQAFMDSDYLQNLAIRYGNRIHQKFENYDGGTYYTIFPNILTYTFALDGGLIEGLSESDLTSFQTSIHYLSADLKITLPQYQQHFQNSQTDVAGVQITQWIHNAPTVRDMEFVISMIKSRANNSYPRRDGRLALEFTTDDFTNSNGVYVEKEKLDAVKIGLRVAGIKYTLEAGEGFTDFFVEETTSEIIKKLEAIYPERGKGRG